MAETAREVTIEEATGRFLALVNEIIERGATNFAADLLAKGMNVPCLYEMSQRWRDWGYDPPELADEMNLLAVDIQFRLVN